MNREQVAGLETSYSPLSAPIEMWVFSFVTIWCMMEENGKEWDMKEPLAIISTEINMINGICERYFDRMYNNIGFTLTFYGVIIAAGLNSQVLEKSLESKIILMYLLPFGTYLLGVLYCNNILQIEKAGFIQLHSEMNLKILLLSNNKKIGVVGWVQAAKTDRTSSLLSYGIIFAAYIISPAASISLYCYQHIWKDGKNTCLIEMLNITTVLPIIFYVVYIIFMIIFVFMIFKIRTRIGNTSQEFNINGQKIISRPILYKK